MYIQDKTSIFVQFGLDLLCSHRVTISEIELQSINQWSIQPDYLKSLIIIQREREREREADRQCRVSLFFFFQTSFKYRPFKSYDSRLTHLTYV